jgi:hypothetical protein
MDATIEMEVARKSSTDERDLPPDDAAIAAVGSGGQPIRHYLPPIADQFLPVLELNR